MTTQTLRGVDRHLLNKGFILKAYKNLGPGFEATYQFISPQGEIWITLHDLANGHWAILNFSHSSAPLLSRMSEILSQLQALPGYTPNRI